MCSNQGNEEDGTTEEANAKSLKPEAVLGITDELREMVDNEWLENLYTEKQLMIGTPKPEDSPLAALFWDRVWEGEIFTEEAGEDEEQCELCSRPAVARGPLDVNERFYPSVPYCEICFTPPEDHRLVDDLSVYDHPTFGNEL